MQDYTREDVDRIRASGLFDEKWYLQEYPDVKALGMDPVEHYLWLGRRLGRKPSAESAAAAAITGLSVATRLTGTSDDALIGDRNSSTYHAQRRYEHEPASFLDAIGARYLAYSGSRDIVFYSAVTGGYDHPVCHEHLIDEARYLLFNDTGVGHYVYEGRVCPFHDEDPTRRARFVKTHPHQLAGDARIAIWLDGNILVRGDLRAEIAEFAASGMPIGAVPHPLRRSVYEEAAECARRGKDDAAAIEQQVARYRREGFDCQNLVESNFMMFRIGHPLLAPAMDAWWAEIERGSRRDQLSFNYALARAGADYFPLTSRPDSVRNHPRLALFHHGSNAESPRPRITPPVRDTASYADVMPARIAAQAHRRADIVVCVHNALDVVILCLESVAQNRDETRHRIVIVDDGSGEETKAWLESFAAAHANVLLVRHEAAGGYTRAANAGLSRMDADFLVLLNSDTIVAGRWVEKMMDAAFSSPGVGIVGPLSSAASHQSIPDHRSTAGQTAVNDMPEGYSVADMNFWCERNAPADFVPRVPLVHGFCYGLTRETVERVGLFDEASFPFGYGEENDYCLRATNAGVGLVVATHTYVYHKKSQSYKDGDRRIGLMRDGNQKIRDLHGAERVIRAVKAMQENPALVRMRKLAEGLFYGRNMS